MLSKLYKSSIVLLFVLFAITAFSQSNDAAISLDSIFIKKDATLILNNSLGSKDLSKKGINFTVKYLDNRKEDYYTVFDIPVKAIEAILVDNKLISLEIKLEESNERIENLEKTLIKYLGDFNIERSKKMGSNRELYFEEEDNYFLLDAFLSINNNMGHLSIGYITKDFIELDKKMKNKKKSQE